MIFCFFVSRITKYAWRCKVRQLVKIIQCKLPCVCDHAGEWLGPNNCPTPPLYRVLNDSFEAHKCDPFFSDMPKGNSRKNYVWLVNIESYVPLAKSWKAEDIGYACSSEAAQFHFEWPCNLDLFSNVPKFYQCHDSRRHNATSESAKRKAIDK